MPSPLPSIHYRSVERDNERNIKKEREIYRKKIAKYRKKKKRVRACLTSPSSDVERLRERQTETGRERQSETRRDRERD